MAERKNNSRRAGSERDRARRDRDYDTYDNNKTPGLIHCDKCGEDYSATYKRCPFCDEMPDREGGGRRQTNRRGGGYGAPVNPIQVATVVISLVIIIAAIFIVVTKLGPLFFGSKDKDPVDPNPGTSQVDPAPVDPTPVAPDTPVEPQPVEPDVPALTVNSLALNKTDFTLKPDEYYTIQAKVDPEQAVNSIVWTSSNPEVLKVTDSGTVTNVNKSGERVKVIVTATVGDKSASCEVYCKPGGTGPAPQPGGNTPAPAPTPTPTPEPKPEPQQPANSNLKVGGNATITGAGGGLNIRSGPGTSYDVVASAGNGALVTVKQLAEGGWVQIDYGNGKLGYVSGSFLQPK